jgi:MFS family permease
MSEASNPQALNTVLDVCPLRPIHWKIWWLSAMGVFLDGFDLFIIGIALPLIVFRYHPSNALVGLLAASASFGAIFGALTGGVLTDRWGRKTIYVLDMLCVAIFALASACAGNLAILVAMRFLMGLSIGADYPICASYVSEFMPARLRGRMLISAFSFQALGMLAAAASGALLLYCHPAVADWRWMLGLPAIPALIVLVLRLGVPESARWYLEHGHYQKAAAVVALVVPEKREILRDLMAREAQRIEKAEGQKLGYADLFGKKYRRRTVLATVPWLLMDIATYGIGIFTPFILAAFVVGPSANIPGLMDDILKDRHATEGAAFLDLFLIVGFILNILLVERLGRIRLQVLGFAGMAAGMALLAIAGSQLDAHAAPDIPLVFLGFILFNLMANLGPNATTFLLPAELFPTKIRASGHGLAAGCAKFGAAMGLLFLPSFKNHFGIVATVIAMSLVCLAALIVTVATRIETTGRCLEDLHPGEILAE